ncbi:MAG: hypothetical protein LBV12_06450 [Puniceicoccales bacterium]|jgi:hypothetical protein|nr:hypothetical protein [Puniceicoccales bacterium]
MKQETVFKFLQLLLVAVGGLLSGNGFAHIGADGTTTPLLTSEEVQTGIGAIMALGAIGWAAWDRRAAAKAAEAAKQAANAAGKTVSVLCIGLLMLGSTFTLTGCNLTTAEKEAIGSILLNVVKAGLNVGLNALAKKVPELAGVVPQLQAKFQITFSEATPTTTPTELAQSLREDVLVIVAEPEHQETVLNLLADSIGAEIHAHESATASGAANATDVNDLAEIEYARRVREALLRK